MKTYVILLRGVMPKGKNKVPMAQLRQLLTNDGFEEVRTYIQSGNIVLRTSLSVQELEERVYHLIKDHLGAELVVAACTRKQLQKILASNPFQQLDISRVFFTVFAQKPDVAKVQELSVRDYSPEQIVVTEEAAYLYIPGNAARSVLSNNFLEKKLGISATTRNHNTMTKLIALSSED